jgi:hypothetical protein
LKNSTLLIASIASMNVSTAQRRFDEFESSCGAPRVPRRIAAKMH